MSFLKSEFGFVASQAIIRGPEKVLGDYDPLNEAKPDLKTSIDAAVEAAVDATPNAGPVITPGNPFKLS